MNLNWLKPKPPFKTVDEAKNVVCKNKNFDKEEAPCLICRGSGLLEDKERCPVCRNGRIPNEKFLVEYYWPELKKYKEKFALFRNDENVFRKMWAKLDKNERNILIKLIQRQ